MCIRDRAIAAQGSFKKAADMLYVTQPAVSLQIQNLEKQLEITIFDRGGRKALLTEAGRLLLEYCERILNQSDEACKAIEDLNSLKGGTLIIGASQTTGTYLMPRMIGLFRQKYPEVSVQLKFIVLEELAGALLMDKLTLPLLEDNYLVI